MPCRDYYDDHPEAYFGPKIDTLEEQVESLRSKVSFAESALCQTLAALETLHTRFYDLGLGDCDFYDQINVKEAGITKKELVDWHTKHKALDEKHRAEEAAKKLAIKREKAKKIAEAKKLEALKSSGLAKLSEAERKALGIKT